MLAKIAPDQLFRRLDKLDTGTLKLTTPDGKVRFFSGKKIGEKADITLHDWRVIKNIIQKGDIGFADDYRSGRWESNNLTRLVTLGLINRSAMDRLVVGGKIFQVISMLSYLFKVNSLRGSKRNIHAHYDLGNDFYKLWLDPSMTYSAALFTQADESLKQAQDNKYDRIVNCLKQRSGSLLEVGCGWGGFSERAQAHGDFAIKGITLSEEQHDYAQKRLQGSANIVLEDYRHQQGKFDNIVSIEMFEAVGERYWSAYFKKISQLLAKKGTAVIQTITMNNQDFPRYRRGGDFIRSYIFPGGMLPSSQRFQEEASKAGLKCANSFYFGQDYARTLEHWLKTFDQKTSQIKQLGFDDGFIRLWRFYLAACIAGFKTERTDVMQVELSHV